MQDTWRKTSPLPLLLLVCFSFTYYYYYHDHGHYHYHYHYYYILLPLLLLLVLALLLHLLSLLLPLSLSLLLSIAVVIDIDFAKDSWGFQWIPMAIAWIPLCFLALAAQRLFGIRHTMYSVFSLVHFWDLSQGLLGLVFLSSEHFLCTSPKNQSGSRRNSSRRAWVAHGTGAKKCFVFWSVPHMSVPA